MKPLESTLYDKSIPNRKGVPLPDIDVPESEMDRALLRDDLALPELGELQVVRHFTRLSQLNHAIDLDLYPLGSCTMKYNPRLNEDVARLPGLATLHPLSDVEGSQGALALMFQLQDWLAELSGMTAVSLQPAAGAQGELAGILMIRAYHQHRGDTKRDIVLVPNSAHGTNPATVTMAGYRAVELPSDENGDVDLNALRAACNDQVAGMMITVPSTLGLFEGHVLEVVEAIHSCGGLMYMDGANMNALMGVVKPGELGFDVMHYNLHKTMSTPHGGGGPGSGPVAVNEKLVPFLPGPVVAVEEETVDSEEAPRYVLNMPEHSIGRLKAFNGNFGMHIRAFAYMSIYGGSGLHEVSKHAFLNANYIRANLADTYHIPYPRMCAHECVISGHIHGAEEVQALDISKRLMDYGFHPPTNYFPLIVHEALMIEPTETEDKATLDRFIDAMKQIAREAHEQPELLLTAPHNMPVKRLDEVKAAKELVLCCKPAMPQHVAAGS